MASKDPTAKERKKIQGWKEATVGALRKMNPIGLIELPDNIFIVMFDRELTDEEKQMAKVIRLEKESIVYAYTYNVNYKFRKMIDIFEANIIYLYGNVVVYDKKVDETNLSGIWGLQFKFKTQIDVYSVKYNK